jgi:CRISPR-associated helicase Cas3
MPLDVVAHTWTSGRKKAILADTITATIDHLLMAALQSRHVQLRHLGLLRQVVVLDEIHAADTWMHTYLERALEWLARYGVPVVALSATLPPGQRTALVHAYERGRRARLSTAGSVTPATDRTNEELPTVPATHDYPLITTLAAGEIRQESALSPATQHVGIDWLSEGEQVLVDRLDTELADGGCVLVVCNTVTRARARYESLSRRFGERVTLTHSRFIARDRALKDSDLVSTFGPPSGSGHNPRDGRIVVSTQVAEQSLDIDFDLLITDLAPIDVVLQRIGRLHRHTRPRPVRLAHPSCLVTGVTRDVTPVMDSGSVKVYGAHLLLRSAALIQELVNDGRPIRLPSDVPVLVDRCYGDAPLGPEPWQRDMAGARVAFEEDRATTRLNSRTFVIPGPSARGTVSGWLTRSVGQAGDETEGAKQVRAPDGGFEVVLLEQADDGLALLAHLDDPRPIRTDIPLPPDTSRALAGSIVRVPGWVTDYPSDVNAIFDDLNENYFPSWQKDPVMAGQVILVLDSNGRGRMGPFSVSYDPTVGLEVSRATS